MKDIARDLGVSVITISKVLRNHPDVGDETRERVLARVKELDYRPNLAARSLVTGRTYLVGLVVPDLLHPFFAEIAKSLSDVLRESGYYLIISSSEEDPNLEEQEINHLLARRLDTLIVASCRSTVDLFFRIEKQQTPYVLIDRSLPGLSANFVGVDDEAVGMLATGHLIDIGCKRSRTFVARKPVLAFVAWRDTSEHWCKPVLKFRMTTSSPNEGRCRNETARCGSHGPALKSEAET